MDNIKKYIADKRPTLSKSSITTYSSILKNLYSKIFGEGVADLDRFEDCDKVIEFLKDMPPNKRKTILSSLVIITDKKNTETNIINMTLKVTKELALN